MPSLVPMGRSVGLGDPGLEKESHALRSDPELRDFKLNWRDGFALLGILIICLVAASPAKKFHSNKKPLVDCTSERKPCIIGRSELLTVVVGMFWPLFREPPFCEASSLFTGNHDAKTGRAHFLVF